MSVRSSHQRGSIKKLFLKIFQYSQENTCVRDSLLKVNLTQVFPVDNCFLAVSMAHYQTGLKVQGLDYIIASGFRVQVTGLVFNCKSTVSRPTFENLRRILLMSQLSFYIGYFWLFQMFSGQFRWFQVVLLFQIVLGHFISFQVILDHFGSFSVVLDYFSLFLSLTGT